jgi:hypothetical protein
LYNRWLCVVSSIFPVLTSAARVRSFGQLLTGFCSSRKFFWHVIPHMQFSDMWPPCAFYRQLLLVESYDGCWIINFELLFMIVYMWSFNRDVHINAGNHHYRKQTIEFWETSTLKRVFKQVHMESPEGWSPGQTVLFEPLSSNSTGSICCGFVVDLMCNYTATTISQFLFHL